MRSCTSATKSFGSVMSIVHDSPIEMQDRIRRLT